MITYLQTFFDAVVGASVPSFFVLLVTLALCSMLVRSFFRLFNWRTDYFDFAVKIALGVFALAQLGGLEWAFSLL